MITFKRFLIATGLLVGVVVGWYAQSRLLANRRALAIERTGLYSADARPTDGLTIGTYNIAHGRGGRFGASNWTGTSRQQLTEHLHRIADQMAAAQPDIMILNEADLEATWSRRLHQPRIIAQRAGSPYLATQRNMDVAFFHTPCPFQVHSPARRECAAGKLPLGGIGYADGG